MRFKSKKFWIGVIVPCIPTLVAFGVWLWMTGGSTAVASVAITDLQTRVAAVEHADQERALAIARIEKDVAWIVRSMGGVPTAEKPGGAP